MDKGVIVNEADVAKLKDMWRSENAKKLLKVEEEVESLHWPWQAFNKLGESAKAIVDGVEAQYNETLVEMQKSAGMLGIAQACYKVLKASEERDEIVEDVVTYLNERKMNISPNILKQIEAVRNK